MRFPVTIEKFSSHASTVTLIPPEMTHCWRDACTYPRYSARAGLAGVKMAPSEPAMILDAPWPSRNRGLHRPRKPTREA